MSQLYLRKTDKFSYRDRIPLRIVRAESELSSLEKAYLCAVEKGDYASVKQALIEAEIYFKININCIDPLGRTALLIAIENENLEIIELLLSFNVYVGDALLHAIRKEVVGAVELLLNHKKSSGGMQVRWQSLTNLLQSFLYTRNNLISPTVASLGSSFQFNLHFQEFPVALVIPSFVKRL